MVHTDIPTIKPTCFGGNWSPPKVTTQGLMPPVPIEIKNRPTIGPTLKDESKQSENRFHHKKKSNKNAQVTLLKKQKLNKHPQ